MKSLILIATTLFIVTTFANERLPILCYSTGQCQQAMGIELGWRNFVVRKSPSGCEMRAYHMSLGSTCEFVPNKPWGVCVRESFPIPSYNPDAPDCSNAIDPSDL